jgi:hypothetical protein
MGALTAWVGSGAFARLSCAGAGKGAPSTAARPNTIPALKSRFATSIILADAAGYGL